MRPAETALFEILKALDAEATREEEASADVMFWKGMPRENPEYIIRRERALAERIPKIVSALLLFVGSALLGIRFVWPGLGSWEGALILVVEIVVAIIAGLSGPIWVSIVTFTWQRILFGQSKPAQAGISSS